MGIEDVMLFVVEAVADALTEDEELKELLNASLVAISAVTRFGMLIAKRMKDREL